MSDAAQVSEGKLYVLGAGWSQFAADLPVNMALACIVSVPWGMMNEPISVRTILVDADENIVDFGRGPIEVESVFEVGRPPGFRQGMYIDVPFAFNFPGVQLEEGSYAWKLEVNYVERERIPIQAVSVQNFV